MSRFPRSSLFTAVAPVVALMLAGAAMANEPLSPVVNVAPQSDPTPAPQKLGRQWQMSDNSTGVKPDLFNSYVGKWFDALVDYAKPYETGAAMARSVDMLRSVSNLVANSRNITGKMVPAIEAISAIPIGSDAAKANADARLRDNLLEHINSVTRRSFKDEFRLSVSKTSNDVSAASEFCSLVRQALDYAQKEVAGT